MNRSIATILLSAAMALPQPGASAAAGATGPVTPAVTPKARPIPLRDVRLTGGPLKQAQDRNAAYLLSLSPDRMMAFLRKAAGLEPKAAGYGGWDGDDRQLTGHIAGHYLSGVSLMFAATGDPLFKERADYLVTELGAVQDKHGDGYIGAQTDRAKTPGKALYDQVAAGDIRSAGFDLNGMWSPWYVQHKIFAGLRDAYRFAGNRKALEIETRFAAWAERVLSKLDDAQIQKMLGTEFGGMNEVLVDLWADTGDDRWLRLADRFEHRAFVEPLVRGEDILRGKHGNTQVPKMLGVLARHIFTGRPSDGAAAQFFWERVALHHSFATGGHGRNEYFGEPDALGDLLEGRTAETCNVYNMIKFARALFALDPQIRYADFHERALFNHILGSMDPADGATCYMVPVGQGVVREYQDMEEDFTCCVGSGMESHALHGDGLYLRVGRHAVGQYLRAVDRGLEGGRRPLDRDDILPGRGGCRHRRRDEEGAPVHGRAAPSVLGGRGIRGQGQRQGREGPGLRPAPMSVSSGSGGPATGWSSFCPSPSAWSLCRAGRAGPRSCGARSSWRATWAPCPRGSPATRPSRRPRRLPGGLRPRSS